MRIHMLSSGIRRREKSKLLYVNVGEQLVLRTYHISGNMAKRKTIR